MNRTQSPKHDELKHFAKDPVNARLIALAIVKAPHILIGVAGVLGTTTAAAITYSRLF